MFPARSWPAAYQPAVAARRRCIDPVTWRKTAMASNTQPYGPPINDALKDPSTTLDTLVKLRHRALATLRAQGDLKEALRRLEREINRRSKATSRAGKSSRKKK